MIPEVMGQRLGARGARVTMMKSMIAAGVAVALDPMDRCIRTWT